jgi:hypothetical protein
MRARGQVVVIVAILLVVVLTLLAVAVDGGRLYIERSRLRGAAQSAADAGISWVAEEMVTMAVPRQTDSARLAPCLPDGEYGERGASCTATPQPADISHWLTDDDRETLVAPGVRATVEAVADGYAARNGLDRNGPDIESMHVSYPYDYDPEGPSLTVRVFVRQRVNLLLVGLLGQDFALIEVAGRSEIPQQ